MPQAHVAFWKGTAAQTEHQDVTIQQAMFHNIPSILAQLSASEQQVHTLNRDFEYPAVYGAHKANLRWLVQFMILGHVNLNSWVKKKKIQYEV